MNAAKQSTSDFSDENVTNDNLVSDLGKIDYLLIVLIGILPFVVSTIIYAIMF